VQVQVLILLRRLQRELGMGMIFLTHDLGPLHDAVKAREGVPGQAPAAPELMMALWLWATVDGVGSARQLTRMCEQHLAYRWLCGGVSMNYHTLSDFRVAHAAVLDQGAQHQPPIGDRRRAFPNPAAWLRVMRSWTACRQTSSRRYRRYRAEPDHFGSLAGT